MKRSLLYIGILFSAVSCGRNDHSLQSGDLLFQAGESSDMTGAITAATGENGRLNFSHVGIAVVKNGADSVLEATTNGGVRLTALPEFLARSAKIGGRPTVVAMRLKDTAGVSEAVRREITSDSPTTTLSDPTTGNSIAANWSGNVTGQTTVRRSSRPVR